MSDYDSYIIEKWRQGDEGVLRLLIEQHQNKVFRFLFCLLGRNYNKAYDIGVDSFVRGIRDFTANKKGTILVCILAAALRMAEESDDAYSHGESEFNGLPPGKRKILEIVDEALQTLPFSLRASLLLRDQTGLAVSQIALLFNALEHKTRSQILQAKKVFREHVEERLKHGA